MNKLQTYFTYSHKSLKHSLRYRLARAGEWDSQHGEIEVYDNNGKHKGAFDPETGKQVKKAIPKRTPTYKSVALDNLKKKKAAQAPEKTPAPQTHQAPQATPAPQTPEAIEAARKEAIRQQATTNPYGGSIGYPAPLGVVVPPAGSQIPQEAVIPATTFLVFTILDLATGGALTPVLIPLLAP